MMRSLKKVIGLKVFALECYVQQVDYQDVCRAVVMEQEIRRLIRIESGRRDVKFDNYF